MGGLPQQFAIRIADMLMQPENFRELLPMLKNQDLDNE